ncbi:hypothetical protein EDD27_5996 [Nonomuraea polychroma]|uniref:Uncharacterized protein n=1 Tax=Nonomuraea polychroma TaxID=46176 RepID=A0A438MC49_9ACTN|nr:hypothetical protein EDD27_5996 [Nonomuraea polychroma]
MTESEEHPKARGRDMETSEVIGFAGLIAIVGGVILAVVQANSGPDDSPWVTIFIGVALVGVGLRIEAAIRDRSRG